MAAIGAWSVAELWAAGSHHRAICGPDGSCPPNAYHFGFYQTQWRTWPTPPRAEEQQRKPEAVTLPKVQPPGVTEEDLDVPPQPKGAPKGEPAVPSGEDAIKPPPKTDLDSKQPSVPGIDDILRPPVAAPPPTTPPAEAPPKTKVPAQPDPFKDDRTEKDKELGDILKGFDEGKKPEPRLDETPPLRPQPAPDDLPIPERKKDDDPLKDLPKIEGTTTSATTDLSALDLSPRPRPRQVATTIAAAATFETGVVRVSALSDTPKKQPSPNQSASTSPPRELSVDRADNPLRSGWSPRRGASPLRSIAGASAEEDGEPSWSARKNPLRDK
jgi:hypothetical protein